MMMIMSGGWYGLIDLVDEIIVVLWLGALGGESGVSLLSILSLLVEFIIESASVELGDDSVLVEGGAELIVRDEVVALDGADGRLVLSSILLMSESLVLKVVGSGVNIVEVLLMILLSVCPSGLYEELIIWVVLASVDGDLSESIIGLGLNLLVTLQCLLKLAHL
jgi:hypothetical protein